MSTTAGRRQRSGAAARLTDVLRSSGQVGRDLLKVDWASTPLGPMTDWSQSLQAAVRIMISSRFSMWMAWGPELTFFCNDAYRRDTLGVKYPWALGRSTREVWAEIWDDIGPRIDGVIKTGTATWDEALLLFLERSGYREETYHTFSYSPLADDDGVISGLLCVVSEETQRIVADRRMSTLRDLGSEPTGVEERQVWAAARRHLAANQRSLPFTLLYAFDQDGEHAELVCSTGFDLPHPAAPAQLDDDSVWPLSKAAAGKECTLTDLAERFADLPTGGWDEPPVEAFAVPLEAPGEQRPYGVLITGLNRYRPFDDGYRDFLRLVASQLAARIAVVRAYEVERTRAEALAELDQAKTAFFTNISHEFRTPLTLLLGPAEDALIDQEAPLPVAQRQRVELVSRNAQRLLRLVNSLLDFSRLESGRLYAQYEPVDLSQLTTDLAATFESAVLRAGLELIIDCRTLPEPVFLDREMWAKVVLNLLSNALKFTFEGGITIRTAADGKNAVLTVTDTGIGIAEPDQAKLFERFHRVVGARSRSHEGSGIGLALVAELAEQHGGSVGVRSTPGVGTSFTVTIPFGTAHLPQEQISRPAAHGASVELAEQQAAGFVAEALRWLEPPHHVESAGSRAGSGPRVLVVDDNADMRDYLAHLLGADYTVDVAADGQEALELINAQLPDLVLTDVMMPRLDGFGLLRALRADRATMHIPVVMVSARAGEEGVVEGLGAGADDYLVKPFAARELLARVRSSLELDRSRRTQQALRQQQQLLDQAQRLARLGSWELQLRTGRIIASEEFLRIVGTGAAELGELDLPSAVDRFVHPEDRTNVMDTFQQALARREPFTYELRLINADEVRLARIRGEVITDDDGQPAAVRGSMQDITEQNRIDQALAAATASREAAAREHSIADQLQRSLLPTRDFAPDQLDVATYYRAGVAGTQVGGDWYDVIKLGAGRTAIVIGDVMGRGVAAAAIMGQLRSALRAFAHLDLPPADVLEQLDGVVRDLGEDQIVTCIYAVYDPHDRALSVANAGHLPPLLIVDGECQRVGEAGPPLGSGPVILRETEINDLPPGAVITLYTDGLVEHRARDIEAGITLLGEALVAPGNGATLSPEQLVAKLLPEGPDDDVAMLIATVPADSQEPITGFFEVGTDERAVQAARRFTQATLADWGIEPGLADDVVLCAGELATNAVLHGQPPIQLRLRHGSDEVFLQVHDSLNAMPRRIRPTADDEHGRGLQIVAMLASDWGIRPTATGKSVWCSFRVSHVT
ncbi:MAG TPA: SpoIIE family protein phosphatase [Mycobacteriales bacterium]|nr:SpoIIE family protein phosphatase [Mycobacteriales bacterium]HWC34161.1 SpoIIE family protein phosphatase [Mycobacteriales bacterium]